MKKSVVVSACVGFFILAWAFQNCSKGFVRHADIDIVDQSSTQEPESSSNNSNNNQNNNSNNSNNNSNTNPNTNTPTGSSPLPPVTPAPVMSDTCFLQYVSIFLWLNPNDDIREVSLQMSSSKIGTVKIYTGQNPAVLSAESGWFAAFLIEPIAGTQSTTTSVTFRKAGDVINDKSISCQLGPKDASQMLLSRLVYNFSNTLTLAGYLGSAEKFMACKSNNSDMPITFMNADGRFITLQPGQPFVLKRGCYP